MLEGRFVFQGVAVGHGVRVAVGVIGVAVGQGVRVLVGVIGVTVGHGVRDGVRVHVGRGVRVADAVKVGPGVGVLVRVAVGVRVPVAVRVAVAVFVAVPVAVGAGGSPVTVKVPVIFQICPINMRTSYSPGSQLPAGGFQSVYPYPPEPPSQGLVSP